jgi:hypothetical protein
VDNTGIDGIEIKAVKLLAKVPGFVGACIATIHSFGCTPENKFKSLIVNQIRKS